MRILDCPVCRQPMIAVEYGGVEIDWCGACEGIWLDGGELEALLGTPNPPPDRPDASLGPPDRDCPICVDKLVKMHYGTTDVVVDKCPHGDGIWLDKGELQAILAAYRQPDRPAAGHDDRAATALTDFFQDPPAGPTGPPEPGDAPH